MAAGRSSASRKRPRSGGQASTAAPAASAGGARARKGAVPDLDRLIHERLRLAIVSALAAHNCLSFRDLKDLLQTSDGNLSVHARKLEDAGYVACEKSFAKRVPKTEYRLTAEGRRAFERYLTHLEALVQNARRRP